MIENLNKIHSYEMEWLKSKNRIKSKLKPYLWFYENLHAFGFIGLFCFYLLLDLPITSLLLFKISYFLQWFYLFLFSSTMNSLVQGFIR